MARLDILEYPDPRLQMRSEVVTEFDNDLGCLVDNLLDTLSAHKALGLSAPQIDDLRQVLVIDVSEDSSAPQVYVNPEILAKSAWGLVEESCLSIPGVVGNVFRATEIRVRAQDQTGEFFESDLKNMNAVCLQHEMDHLAGKLFIDRLSIFRRLRIRSQMKARAREQSSAA